jgi:acetoin utilization protein AcuC
MNATRAVFIAHDLYRQPAYGRHHPLAIPRVEAVFDLCSALGWFAPGDLRASPRASESELARFHAPGYVAALRTASDTGAVDASVRARYCLGTMENPLFPGLYERAATSVGGSLLAARLALDGHLAFHPAGGTHHGRSDRASGFCYFNDVVLAIREFLDRGVKRVLYVDLDAHHGDAVQDAYAVDARVYTVSLHERARWPHTGEASDSGGGNAWNLPVPAHFNDSELDVLMRDVVLALAKRLAPQALVVTCGADALAGDPLSSMGLSNVALWSAVDALVATAKASVVLGGGGYNPWTLARYWAGLWAHVSGRDVPFALPQEASNVLRGLRCELIEDEDVRPEWLATMADRRNDGPVRDEVLRLRDDAAGRLERRETVERRMA